MVKPLTLYICQECGTQHSKWLGQCIDCGGWNTLSQESIRDNVPKGLKHVSKTPTLELVSLEGHEEASPRHKTHNEEFDRVTGGGLVPGSVILVGGDPGIGKSTLLLQVAAQLSHHKKCLYISGEEGVEQIRMRAKRLEAEKSPLQLVSATNIGRIMATLDHMNDCDLVIIDSIQTMYIDNIESAPGTVTQVRMCSQELIRHAKEKGLVIILVGHVTKDGSIAGPRVLEHMVDAVLYFEGDRGHQFRILRSVKNRFGASNEIGVFEMVENGLMEVKNPSELFLEGRHGDVSGSVVFAGIEGTRPLLVEIQTLVATSPLGMPRRTVIGWDVGRLSMVIAVLETRCGLSFAGKDVYLNVAGGLKISEPAADLAVASALISALYDIPIPPHTVVFGEIGLSGEIRPVGHIPARLKEAEKLGFKNAILPPQGRKNGVKWDMDTVEIDHIFKLLRQLKTDKKK